MTITDWDSGGLADVLYIFFKFYIGTGLFFISGLCDWLHRLGVDH